MRVAGFLILLGLVVALALLFARPRSGARDLAIRVLGQTNLASGQSVTLLLLSNASNVEIQMAGEALEVRTMGSTNMTQRRMSGSPLYLKPSQTSSVRILPQGQGREWRLRIQYYTKGKKQVKDKLFWRTALPGRTLRHIFMDSVATEWISDS